MRAAMQRTALLVSSAVLCLPAVFAHAQTVYKCVDANGKVLYANSPCPSTNPTQQKRLSGDALKGTVVQMPKGPVEEKSNTNPLESLKQKPIDIDERIKEGDPALNQERKPLALEKMQKKLDEAKKQMDRARQDMEKMWDE